MTDRWTHTSLPQRLEFGSGAVSQLGELAGALGAQRVLLLTTAGRAASPEAIDVRRSLGERFAGEFAGVVSHVPAPVVDAAVAAAADVGADALVSFGGGSCADAGKALCHRADPASPIAHIAVPTTYSGAEVTPFYGVTDPATGEKTGAGGARLAPAVVVYDPVVTLSTSPRVSAETGMNALAHCVEVAWSPRRTPEAEAVALAGAARIFEELPEVVAAPADLGARARLLAGAALAGRCLQNATMGVHHGLAQLVGARAGIPHGLANAVILPHAMRFNGAAVPEATRRLADAFGVPGDPAAAVQDLAARLGLPSRLSECGVSDADLLAVAAAAGRNRSVRANPRPVGEAEALALLAAAR
jgi:maleylacetate reductase